MFSFVLQLKAMSHQHLPTYSIHNLKESRFSPKDFMADHFPHYLEEHKDLRFPHKHSFYQLVYFAGGKGSHSIDFVHFPVEPGQLYFMVPGQVHSWDFEGEVDGYIINFSTTFFQSFLLKANYLEDMPFFAGITKDAVIDIPEGLREKVINLFEELIAENETINPLGVDLVKALMLQLFIQVARLKIEVPDAVAPSYNYTLLRSFQKLIEKNYMQLRLPKQYAELLYITPNHLNALCNDVLGISAGEVIRNRIVLEAKRLLINHEMTVLEIANHLNFADNSYFTKFFKKQEGITPEEFRKKSDHHVHIN